MRGHFTLSGAAALLGLAMVVAVLGVATFSASTEMVPESGGTYIEGLVGRPQHLNPILAQPNEPDEDLSALIFSGLTRIGDDGVVGADLAQRWDVTEEGRLYTFYLRPEVRWHDGEPFTADDVLFTVRLLQDPSFPGQPETAELWRNVEVEKDGPLTVRFRLRSSYAPFLEYTSLGILPRHLLGDVPVASLATDPFNSRPVGTGPYRVLRAAASEVTLQANPSYYGRLPYLDRLVFRFYPDAGSALDALQKGGIQGLGRVPAPGLATLQERQVHGLYTTPELSRLTVLILNNRYPPLDQPEVRQAMAHALDRESLIDVGLGGQGQSASGPIIPSSWAFKPDLTRRDYSPETARALLEQSGWLDSDRDGVREKDGQPLRLVLLTNDNPERVSVAEEIQAQLRSVGIAVELQGAPWEDLVSKFLVPHNYQMVLAEQSFPNADPDVYTFWHSSQVTEGLNFAGWSSRKADDLLERARQTTDRAQREPLYEEFQKVFAEEEPSLLLYYPAYTYAVSKEVKGVRLGLLLSPADRFRHIDEWYVKSRLVFRFGDEPD